MSVNTTPVAPRPVPLTIIGTNPASRTYRVGEEDHSLGNCLRNILVKGMESEVDFAGYSVPHPSEAILQMRVQLAKTAKCETADDALVESCEALEQMCEHVTRTVAKRHEHEVKIE